MHLMYKSGILSNLFNCCNLYFMTYINYNLYSYMLAHYQTENKLLKR